MYPLLCISPVHVVLPATSHFVLAVMAFTGTLVYMVSGNFSGVHQTIALIMGVVLGVQLGACMSNRIRGTWIIRSLALVLEFVGIRILVMLFQEKT